MEFFVISIICLVLLPLVVGWLIIGASLLLTPLMGGLYLMTVLPDKFRLKTEVNTENGEGVLIVDDQYLSVIPLIKLLEQAKVPIKYVSDGFEAIREMRRKHYRLVFMDFYMPILSGLETLARVDNLMSESSQPTPVIFYTGAEIPEKDRNGFKHMSILESWDKSLNRIELNTRLHRVLLKN